MPKGRITIVYGADRETAGHGETIVYTAWIINECRYSLRGVRLIPRSFTNEAMENLSYTSAPKNEDLQVSVLRPGESRSFSFSYVVSMTDQLHGGEIISSMRVRARLFGRSVWDEHDAIVALAH